MLVGMVTSTPLKEDDTMTAAPARRRSRTASPLWVLAMAAGLLIASAVPAAAVTPVIVEAPPSCYDGNPNNTSIACEVQQEYVSVWGRTGDSAGIRYWAGEIGAGRQSLAGLRQSLVAAAPARTMLTELYRACLNREPDAAGLGYRLGRLAAGSSMYVQAYEIERSAEAVAKGSPCRIIDAEFACLVPGWASGFPGFGLSD